MDDDAARRRPQPRVRNAEHHHRHDRGQPIGTHQAARTPACDSVLARIVGGLVGIGINRPSIQTSSISLSTTHHGHRHRTSYDAEIDLTVTTTQVSLLSRLFDVASRTGASGYQGPNSRLGDGA